MTPIVDRFVADQQADLEAERDRVEGMYADADEPWLRQSLAQRLSELDAHIRQPSGTTQ